MELKSKLKDVRSWLDFLFYELGKQSRLEVCGLYKDGEDRKSTKWKGYLDVVANQPMEFDAPTWINQRSIFPNEVILDLENTEELDAIIQTIKKLKLFYMVWATGSKGYHVNLFFDKELEEEDKMWIIQFFKCDMQKSIDRTMIALENVPHWKSNKIKTLIEEKMFTPEGEIGLNHIEYILKGNAKEYQVIHLTPSMRIGGYS